MNHNIFLHKKANFSIFDVIIMLKVTRQSNRLFRLNPIAMAVTLVLPVGGVESVRACLFLYYKLYHPSLFVKGIWF